MILADPAIVVLRINIHASPIFGLAHNRTCHHVCWLVAGRWRISAIGNCNRSALYFQAFNQQVVEPVQGKNGPLGYLRLTLDTHTLATEAQQVDNTTNILRLMLLLSLAIGVVLTRTLLQGKRTRWQQSPFLLTANKPVEDEDDEKKGNL